MSNQSGSIFTALEKFRREQDKQDALVLKQLGAAYSQLYKRLSEKIELEARRVFEEGGDTVAREWVARRLLNLQKEMEVELTKYSAFIETTLDANTDEMLALGAKHAAALLEMADEEFNG